jgi:adenosylcobinamide kinase / adenosylcobinamide-phosphate guanylyltransferase
MDPLEFQRTETMKKFIFIVGGARSGKSGYAVRLAKKLNKKTAFIATGISSDKEMADRIKKHRLSRPKHWKLIEESQNIDTVLPYLKDKYEVILIDCVGFLVSNLLMAGMKQSAVEKKIKNTVKTITGTDSTVIVVSNEVGSGIVPINELARSFRDLTGTANQLMAKKADEVIFMQCGIALKIKENTLKVQGYKLKGNNK